MVVFRGHSAVDGRRCRVLVHRVRWLGEAGFEYLARLLEAQLPILDILDPDLKLAYGIHEAQFIFKKRKILSLARILH